MKITKKFDISTSVINIICYGKSYTCLFDRLSNSVDGHPRFKVYIIKENYDYSIDFIVSQVYASLYDTALQLITQNKEKLVD